MRGPKKSYTNGEITVIWNPEKCINASYCINDLPEVFNTKENPWVNMQTATTKQIIEAVDACPTLALTWEWNKNL
jgi:uncharacterized Fe-S cluster protein YjdI